MQITRGRTTASARVQITRSRNSRSIIVGHTDNTGTAQHNMALSKQRAEAVLQALVKSYRISPARLEARCYGDTKPVARNDTERNRPNTSLFRLRKPRAD